MPFLTRNLLALTLLSGLAWSAYAQQLFQEGTHYERLPQDVPTSTPGKVEVVEVFWYGCPHCFSLEPQVEKWLENKPENAEFVRVPTTLGRKQWNNSVRAYYTAEKLGVREPLHKAMMEAVHVHKRKLESVDQIKEFFGEHGIDAAKFEKAFTSFEVETKVRRATDLVRRYYRISGVPSIVINGKFKTGGPMAGNQIFEVVNFLVAQEGDAS